MAVGHGAIITVEHERESAAMRPIWKWLGLAGLAGVAATGAVVVRSERRRAAYTPDQVRDRLHERHRQLEQEGPPA